MNGDLAERIEPGLTLVVPTGVDEGVLCDGAEVLYLGSLPSHIALLDEILPFGPAAGTEDRRLVLVLAKVNVPAADRCSQTTLAGSTPVTLLL